jgi:ATP-dependent DNA ligase
MREYKVQGSSSVYTVRENDGKWVCYADSGALCPGWKNSKGTEKTCKHVKMAQRGAVAEPTTAAPAPKPMPTNGERFVKPMLASKSEDTVVTAWHEWAIEEKFDGHRAIVMVVDHVVTAWSRSGKARELPRHIVADIRNFPNGLYDGEVMGRDGGSFADVRRVETQELAYFVVFDILNLLGDNVMGRGYSERRELLGRVFEAVGELHSVRCAESVDLMCEADVVKFVSAVWERGGEGAILKRRAARYQPGARSKDFVKVKKEGSSLVRVTGFAAGERGPLSSVLCVDPTDGMETSVKNESKIDAKPSDIGRMLWIDYTEKTATAFVNPHCDRWEDK